MYIGCAFRVRRRVEDGSKKGALVCDDRVRVAADVQKKKKKNSSAFD